MGNRRKQAEGGAGEASRPRLRRLCPRRKGAARGVSEERHLKLPLRRDGEGGSLCEKTQPRIARFPENGEAGNDAAREAERMPLPSLPEARAMPPEFTRRPSPKTPESEASQTHPGLRRTFINLGRDAFDRRPKPKDRLASSAMRRTALIAKICFSVFALGVSAYSVSRLIPSDWRILKGAELFVEASARAEAIRATEAFWRSYEKAPHAIRSLCEGMAECEFVAISERLACVGAPAFERAAVRKEPSEPGLYHVELPVNGGTLSLLVREKGGFAEVSALSSLNMY